MYNSYYYHSEDKTIFIKSRYLIKKLKKEEDLIIYVLKIKIMRKRN